MTTLTAQQLIDAQHAQVQDLVDALTAIVAQVDAMKTATLEDFQVWNGGLPDVVGMIAMQANSQATTLQQRFPHL